LNWDDDGATTGPIFTLRRNSASPAASDIIGQMKFTGRDSGATYTDYANITCIIIDATDTSEDSRLQMQTFVAGSNGTRLRIDAGLYHPSATGGDKGDNTINFSALYDDNTLLTCGPIELLNTGAVDLQKWDDLTPNVEPGVERQHAVMHAFAAMRAEGFDPRDPRSFVNRMKSDGAVPGLMTEAEWRGMLDRGEKPDIGTAATRTFLAIDNLAVAFAALLDRVEALEAKG
jgi:hypothetical protein